jgi:hypothetical protein
MSSARVQKLNALLARVQERRVQPRRLNVAPAEARAPQPAPAAPLPQPVAAPPVAPVATVPPQGGSAPSLRPDPGQEAARRAPASSPLEDAMAQFGANREDSGPLTMEPLASPIHTPARTPIHTMERPSEPVNQDLLLTHRPEAGSLPPGPIVELVQAKHHPREPTLQFETAVRVNPPTQRDLKPVALAEPPAAAPVKFVEPAPEVQAGGPTHKIEPEPIAAQAAPVRVVSSARLDAPKTFGELLDLSLSLRPSGR